MRKITVGMALIKGIPRYRIRRTRNKGFYNKIFQFIFLVAKGDTSEPTYTTHAPQGTYETTEGTDTGQFDMLKIYARDFLKFNLQLH